jgi:phage terminase large subunit
LNSLGLKELTPPKVEFPDELSFLFEHHPYKTLWGGRDGVKSWSIAQALLLLGTGRIEGWDKPLRILCGRETMDSIRESVHQVLSDQIGRLGLGDFYSILQSEIRGPESHKTEIVFCGLRKQTVSSIKSYEGIDIFWGEEASTVSRRSLTILLPTIRKPGSEIWWSLNPDLTTDPVYTDFVLDPPKGAITYRTSWRDNKWLSAESKGKILTLKEKNPDLFEHVYEGATRSTVEGAIYKIEMQALEKSGRIRAIPHDPRQPVDTFFDLGYGDRVAIWAAQRTPFEIKVLRYFEGDHQAIDYYLREMQTWGYVFGTCYLPWDGATKSLGTGRSIEELIRAQGFKTRVNRQFGVADGINAVRMIFPTLYFDAANCADGLQYLRRYQWGPPTKVGEGRYEVQRSQPLHDDASHAADALRAMAMGIQEPAREKPKPQQPRRVTSAWS